VKYESKRIARILALNGYLKLYVLERIAVEMIVSIQSCSYGGGCGEDDGLGGILELVEEL